MISEIQHSGLRVPHLDGLLASEFQLFDNLLSETAFAAYLLGYDTSKAECDDLIASHASFAEGDDKRPAKRRRQTRVITYLPRAPEQVRDENAAPVAAEITNDRSSFSLRFDVPPREAIDYFKRKQVLPADKFYKLEADARSGAFAISHVYNTDIATALKQELIDALENGTPQAAVIKRLKDILDGAGHKMLGNAHLETVFRTTTQMAYGVGRRSAQEESADYLPIWEYTAVGDERTRPTHMALDGLQYPVNHPFWDKYYPPWEFRCRCSVIPVFDYRKGYDPRRPNDQTVMELDDEGLPLRSNVSGIPVTTRQSTFRGVPKQTDLRAVLTSAGAAALENRRK